MSENYAIQKLKIGPIIRDSSVNQIRVWGQADGEANKTCYLVARQYNSNNFTYTVVNASTNFIGTVTLSGLDTLSQYQIGVLNLDQDLDATKITAASWENIAVYKYKLDDMGNDLSILFGSCRFLWPVRINPFSKKYYALWGESGDKIFGKINALLEREPVDFVAMLGDQIYGDTSVWLVDKLMRAKSFDEFKYRYETAFSYSNIRNLMANNTTYMIGDDHEYRDNYNSSIIRTEPNVYVDSLRAFNLYQYRNGPAEPVDQKYWYTTFRKQTPFFWMDLRNERTPENIMSNEQLTAIKNWLLQYRSDVKFLVSSVPMFLRKADKDNWQNYKSQLGELLEFIVLNQIMGSVVLTGDSHMGVSSQYEIANGIYITEIMSSGFMAVFHESKSNVASEHTVGDFKIKSVKMSDVVSQDMFGKLTLLRNERIIRYTMYDSDGKIKSDSIYQI